MKKRTFLLPYIKKKKQEKFCWSHHTIFIPKEFGICTYYNITEYQTTKEFDQRNFSIEKQFFLINKLDFVTNYNLLISENLKFNILANVFICKRLNGLSSFKDTLESNDKAIVVTEFLNNLLTNKIYIIKIFL